MMANTGQTRTTLGQLCAARRDAIQDGFEPRTVVTLLTLRCSALDHCATQEPRGALGNSLRYVMTNMTRGADDALPHLETDTLSILLLQLSRVCLKPDWDFLNDIKHCYFQNATNIIPVHTSANSHCGVLNGQNHCAVERDRDRERTRSDWLVMAHAWLEP
jgi:hypothetical protein